MTHFLSPILRPSFVEYGAYSGQGRLSTIISFLCSKKKTQTFLIKQKLLFGYCIFFAPFHFWRTGNVLRAKEDHVLNDSLLFVFVQAPK